MIDTITLRTNSNFNLKNFKESYQHATVSFHTDRFYKKCVVYHLDKSRSITIKQDPHHSSAAQTSIHAKLSNLGESFSDVKRNFRNATDLSELEISRIDHNVDIEENITNIHDTLRWHRKRKTIRYAEQSIIDISSSGNLTGYYIGNFPEMIIIYDKAYEVIGKRKLKKVPMTTPLVLTRIEARHKGKKIAHRMLVELENYINTPVFPKCSRIILNENQATTRKDLLKLEEIKSNSSKLGLTSAISFLNRHGNFQREYGHLIEQIDYQEKLNSIYSTNLKGFITGRQKDSNAS